MHIVSTVTRSSFFWIFLGGLCYYSALPPLNIAPLALAVPICWGMVILGDRRQEAGDRQKETGCTATGSVAVYINAYIFWLASVCWVSHPYPPFTTIGLIALVTALSFFWVLFFASARVAVHRYKVPLIVAMPLCWLGTEYLRCHILGGFSFCALEHAFYLYPVCIQFASIGGSILVGGIIMFLGAAVLTLCGLCASFAPFAVKSNRKEREDNAKYAKEKHLTKTSIQILVILFLVLVIPTMGINQWVKKSYVHYFDEDKTTFSIVALQGNRQVYIDGGQEEADKTFALFVHLAYQEIHDRKQAGVPLPDLIVFPETVCPISVLAFEGTVTPADRGWTEEQVTHWEREFRQFAQHIETPVLLGLSTLIFNDPTDDPIRLNSALFVPPSEHNGEMLRYDKMHLVLMGEYVPFAEYLPKNFILRTLCHEARHGTMPLAIPIGGKAAGGRRQAAAEEGEQAAGGRRQAAAEGMDGRRQQIEASVNICFESSVAHLIRQQILTLRKEGHDPRILINLSNDGWFRNSHAIEQHLATHVFRAVENRMYYVTATNGGFSAIINPFGEIQQIGQRGAAEAVSGTVSVNLNVPHAQTIYQKYGDWYALPFAIGVLVLTGIGWRERRSKAKAAI